jgi:predicted transcriptional regulator
VARLIYNGDLTVLSSKVVKTLANRSCGTEDIASRCCTTRDTIRKELHRLRVKALVEHDGRRPRTWKLKETEAA